MSTKAGNLLWNRIRVEFPPSTNTIDVDTGLRQAGLAFNNMSDNEPTLGNPSRVQVVPMSPLIKWAGFTHSEPFVDPNTGTVHVIFTKLAPEPPYQFGPLNVLFWDPHSLIGPGDADTYNDLS